MPLDPVAQVRLLIGDPAGSSQFLDDASIQYALDSFPSNLLLGAAVAAEFIASKLTSKVQSKKVGDLEITYGKQYEQYQERAELLRRRATIEGVKPYAGGISQADKLATEEDTDRVVPSFSIGGMDRTLPINQIRKE